MWSHLGGTSASVSDTEIPSVVVSAVLVGQRRKFSYSSGSCMYMARAHSQQVTRQKRRGRDSVDRRSWQSTTTYPRCIARYPPRGPCLRRQSTAAAPRLRAQAEGRRRSHGYHSHFCKLPAHSLPSLVATDTAEPRPAQRTAPQREAEFAGVQTVATLLGVQWTSCLCTQCAVYTACTAAGRNCAPGDRAAPAATPELSSFSGDVTAQHIREIFHVDVPAAATVKKQTASKRKAIKASGSVRDAWQLVAEHLGP